MPPGARWEPPSSGARSMFGTRSEAGERALERLLTVVRTRQLQHINALVYLTVRHRRAPSASTGCVTAPHDSDALNCYLSGLRAKCHRPPRRATKALIASSVSFG